MNKLRFLIILLFIPLFALSQHKIEGEILAAPDKNFLLAEHFGENIKVVDTLKADLTGNFTYNFPEDAAKGLYRIYISENNWLEIILGWEDVKFQTIAKAPFDALSFDKSFQNKKYYEYLKLLSKNSPERSALIRFVSEYPKDNELKKLAKKKLKKLYSGEKEFIDKLKKEHSESFVTRYLDFLYSEPYTVYKSGNPQVRINNITNKNWTDTLLLNSDAYSSTLFDYLMLHRKQNASREQQKEIFIKAIDSIFTAIPDKNPVYDYAMLYYMQGFEQLKMESVLMHIIKEYAEKCNRTKGNLKNRISFYQNFQTGTKVPDFVLTDLDGNPKKFYDASGGKTLLIFWASWCGHCKQMNGALKEMYPQLKEKGIKILSVSLDNKPSELNAYLNKNPLPWKVWSDFKGWESTVVQKFSLYATPTMLLLDENKKIIGKPLNLNQLVYLINQNK